MKIRESIFDGDSVVVPMADVQHVEKHWYGDIKRTKHNWLGLMIITKHTTWDMEADTWSNNIYVSREEGEAFLKSWCNYRMELESKK